MLPKTVLWNPDTSIHMTEGSVASTRHADTNKAYTVTRYIDNAFEYFIKLALKSLYFIYWLSYN